MSNKTERHRNHAENYLNKLSTGESYLSGSFRSVLSIEKEGSGTREAEPVPTPGHLR